MVLWNTWDALDRLYGSLDARLRPEDVATLVLEALASLRHRERAVPRDVAAHAGRRHGFSGMSDDYARPVGAARQVAATRFLFGVDGGTVDVDDPISVLEFATLAGAEIDWNPVRTDSGQTSLIQDAWPGKAMRVMAADLAAWHQAEGGSLHVDTSVWSRLPLPWEVLDGGQDALD